MPHSEAYQPARGCKSQCHRLELVRPFTDHASPGVEIPNEHQHYIIGRFLRRVGDVIGLCGFMGTLARKLLEASLLG